MLLDVQKNEKCATGTPFWPSAEECSNTKPPRRVDFSISHCVVYYSLKSQVHIFSCVGSMLNPLMETTMRLYNVHSVCAFALLTKIKKHSRGNLYLSIVHTHCFIQLSVGT